MFNYFNFSQLELNDILPFRSIHSYDAISALISSYSSIIMPLSTLKCTIAPTCIDGARHQPDLSTKLSNPLHDTVPLYSVQRGNLAKNYHYEKKTRYRGE